MPNAIKTVILTGCASLALTMTSEPARAQYPTAAMDIYWNETHQVIDGFGTAQPGNLDPGGDYAGILYGRPAEQRRQIMDLAFSQVSGIGLTIYRSPILTSLESSPGAWNYTDPAQTWLMREAAKRGPVKLIASVFSPPAWMKTNRRTNGGYCANISQVCTVDDDCGSGNCVIASLDQSYYSDFADYLSHYAIQYANANGVNIHAMSFTNEPDVFDVPWDTCKWTSGQIAAFLGGFLSPAFANNHVTAKVFGPEAAWQSVESYLGATFNDPTARARLDIAAGHLYSGSPSATFPSANRYHKPIWQTEVSLNHLVWNDEYDLDPQGNRVYKCAAPFTGKIQCGTLQWATDIHHNLVDAGASAWVWWVLALWHNEYSMMSLDGDGTFSTSKTFWMLGNFSKFIRPGFVRIGAQSSNADLLVSAYKDPVTGRFAIVVVNNNDTPFNAAFRLHDFTPGPVRPYITSDNDDLRGYATTQLLSKIVFIPAKSIITYAPLQPEIVWRGSDGAVNLWLMTGGVVQGQQWTGSPDPSWTIQGAGDFDGDGINDLFWRCTGPSCYQTTHGQLAIWYRGQSTRPAPTYPGLVSDDGWQIMGVGDFNGDHRSDVLWEYAGPSGQTPHGQLAIWYSGQMTSPLPSYPVPAVGDDGWRIQGIGDFDGNGSSDILWRYFGPDNHGQLAIWWNGQYASPPAAYPAAVPDDDWRIQAIGDFDGNGRSDILWRYFGPANHGQLAVWWNGQYGSPAAWYPGVVGDDRWQMQGVEDFDADGKSDVLWRFVGPSGQTTHGQLAVWFGAQATNPVPAYPAVVSDDLVFQATGKSGL